MKRVCFVCLGNICRSPLAEGIFRRVVDVAGLGAEFEIESAGVSAYHLGERPDRRAQQTAARHGITLDGVAQQFRPADFERFDLILAADAEVADDLRRMARTAAERTKVRLLREFDPQAGPAARDLDVPDPWYGGMDGFETVYQMIERSCRGLLREVQGKRRDESA